ncbi:MAG: acyl-CoA desaturase [Chitinophagales bacterium]
MMHYGKISYQKEPPGGFFSVLRGRVNALLDRTDSKRFNYAHAKAIAFFLAFIFFYVLLLFSATAAQVIICYTLLGITNFLIILNIVHEAVHGSLFPAKKLNAFASHWLEVLGTSSYFYRKRHIQSHHLYTNIVGLDLDIEQSALVRLSDQEPFRKYHRYQHFYLPLLYFLFSLNWFFIRDTKDYFRFKKTGTMPRWVLPQLILFKINFLFFIIVLPVLIIPVSWYTILFGFLVMNFILSGLAAMALLTAHVGEDAVFPEPDQDGIMKDTWAVHQVRTTHDFATNSPFFNFILGGFNFHVAHHLFPSVSHVNYPAITKIIKQTCFEFGIEYKNEALGKAMLSHFKLLRKTSGFHLESMEF